MNLISFTNLGVVPHCAHCKERKRRKARVGHHHEWPVWNYRALTGATAGRRDHERPITSAATPTTSVWPRGSRRSSIASTATLARKTWGYVGGTFVASSPCFVSWLCPSRRSRMSVATTTLSSRPRTYSLSPCPFSWHWANNILLLYACMVLYFVNRLYSLSPISTPIQMKHAVAMPAQVV